MSHDENWVTIWHALLMSLQLSTGPIAQEHLSGLKPIWPHSFEVGVQCNGHATQQGAVAEGLAKLLSLAGIPLTAGFIGKFYLFTAGIEGEVWMLLSALVVGSAISIYYYLRIIFAMTMKSDDNGALHAQYSVSGISVCVIWLLIFSILYLGVLPESVMQHLGLL